MDWSQTPQTVVAATVSLYWTCVVVMVIRSHIKYRVSSGSLPKTRFEKRMWYLWVPTIAAWIALTWNSDNVITSNSAGSVPAWLATFWTVMNWAAAASAVAAFAMTTRCWIGMGRNWSMAVAPQKDTELITDGFFSSVRHPIYALSLMLMVSSAIVVFNLPMLVVATIHCSMLYIKSWNEERYLTETHGEQYRQYQKQTNRFIPWRAFVMLSVSRSH